jgi:hypothetical protein
MQQLTPYLKAARMVTRAEFIAQHPGHYFIKRPRAGARSAKEEGSFGFNTVAAKLDQDPFADEWRIVPVVKREGNPFPERLTVGRATNCDVILRVPFVSKVHAHVIHEPDGSFSIHDNNPSNRTFLKNRVLEAGATRKMAVGDAIAFGSLEFEFVDAGRLYDILLAECGSTR